MENKPKQASSGVIQLLIVWAILMSFTIAGYFSSEQFFSGRSLAVVLMLLTSVKFLGVSFWFMEIKQAHAAWKWALAIVLILFATIIVFTN